MLAPPYAVERQRELSAKLRHISRRLTRIYLWLTAASFGLFWLVLTWGPLDRPGPGHSWTAWVCGAIAGVMALTGLFLWRRERLAILLCGLSSIGGLTLAAVEFGWGAAAPPMGFAALHAAMAMALGGLRVGSVVTAAALFAAWGLAFGQVSAWYAVTLAFKNVGLVVLSQTALISLASGGGLFAARTVARFMRSAEEREHRFQSLLQIAADAYWEMGPDFRLQALTAGRASQQSALPPKALGQVPWELNEFHCDADRLDQMQADLGARQPFRDVAVDWQTGNGLRHLLVSGEPRFDARSVFLGYWGVVRDVTHEQLARTALKQTESRYQDLFSIMPTALVLHRAGRVVEANSAAAALFGFPDEASMLGFDLLSFHETADSLAVAQARIRRLQIMSTGDSLPVTEYRIKSRRGRDLSLRSTGVVVDTPHGRAALSIYVDDTDRQAAESAVRRSEALLSHLVASSPDVITLTDIETGRYAMVNRSFERLTGWSADEVVGRTSLDLNVWARASDRDRLIAQVREHGAVQDTPVAFRVRDGSVLPLLVSGARFTMDRRDYLVLNARDVTEAERNRLEREAILENASVGIALTRDQTFQLANPAFEAMVGWTDGGIVGQHGSVVWPSTAAYAELGARIGPALARGEQVDIEGEGCRRDGSTFRCRMLARAVDPSHPSRGGTIWVVEDITERHRLNEDLAKARDAAEAASRAKSAFLANTSHELRTPLNGLMGLAQLARSPELDGPRRDRYLDQIVEISQGLSRIVSDILDLAKIEAGRMTVEHTVFDLGEVLQSLDRSHQPLAAMRGLSFSVEAGPGLAWVKGDPLRLRQILTNYLANALKFTANGGVRLVVHRLGGDRVRLEVHDTGPGINETALGRLFQPFTQADESTTRRYGGTGLGLSICRQLAQAMGGQVGASSTVGVGSCFWAELPLPATETAEQPERPVEDLSATQGAHVLMVDDNEVNMMVAVAQLQQFGVRVGQAVDGPQALNAVLAAEEAGDPYDLVMMDLQMPGLSGHEVTQALRRRHPPEVLPIVAYTAAALVSEREAALAAGMNDFLPKPTDSANLRAMVARWAKR